MQNKKARRPSRGNRRLRLESLETRFALAIAAFDVNLYHDDNGEIGAVVANDTLTIGETFFVEITALEYAPYFSGFQGVSLDIQWDPKVLQEVDTTWDPTNVNSPIITSNFPLFRQGTLDNHNGSITNLSGTASIAFNTGRAIGNGIAERFSLLRFKAISPFTASPFEMWQGGSDIATVPVSNLRSKHLNFEAQTITVLPIAPLDIKPVVVLTDGNFLNASNKIESTNTAQIVIEVDKAVPPNGTTATPEIVATLPISNAVTTETIVEPESNTVQSPLFTTNIAVPVFASNEWETTESDLAFGSFCRASIPLPNELNTPASDSLTQSVDTTQTAAAPLIDKSAEIKPASSDLRLPVLTKTQLFESSIRIGPIESVEVQAIVDAVFARHNLDQILSVDDGVVFDSLVEDFLKARRGSRERNRLFS